MQLVERTGRHGWYLRVLEEGDVAAGASITLLERPSPEWSIARAFKAMRCRSVDRQEAAELKAVPTLSAAWRQTLSQY
jgi:MOSC domain-containing protein YiiM